MRVLVPLLVGLLLVGCPGSQERGEALLALIQLESSVRASCMALEVASPQGEVLERLLLERPSGRDALRVAIFRDALPQDVRLRARPLWGSACAEPLVPNGAWVEVAGRFEAGAQPVTVTLAVTRPSASEDADGDGFVTDAQGGPDCDDALATRRPNAQEVCDASADLDCDGLRGCEDPQCPSPACYYVATRLALTPSASTLLVGSCSESFTLERQRASGEAAPGTALAVTVDVAPAGAVTLYSDADCTTPLNGLVLSEGESRARFIGRVTQQGTVELTARAPALAEARQSLALGLGPPSALVIASAAQSLQAGACSAQVVVDARDAVGNPSPVAADMPLTLTSTPAQGLRFYSDAACTTPLATARLAAGASEARFYFKGVTGGQVELSVGGEGLSPALQTQTVRPAVRAGDCILEAGRNNVTCPLSPPLVDRERALLLFQAPISNATPASAFVRCRLEGTDAITCSRDKNTGEARIRWQVLELPQGLRVQHLNAPCSGQTTNVALPQPVSNLAESFVLFSAQQSGNEVSQDDLAAARLTTASNVEVVLNTSSCIGGQEYSLQVVEWAGARVTRGVAGPTSGTTLSMGGLDPVDLARSVLLFSYRGDFSGSNICSRLLRGELDSATSVRFSRGNGANGCDGQNIDAVFWERIELPEGARAWQVPVTVADNSTTANVTLPAPVDVTRTLVFSAGQSAGGQSLGEGTYASDDNIGVAVGRHLLTAPDTLQVRRSSNLGDTRWTAQVLELLP